MKEKGKYEMAKFYNEMLIRNVDCGLLYFQIKNDQAILEYEKLKKHKKSIENGKSTDKNKLGEIQKKIEDLSKEIFSMRKPIKFLDKNKRFYYSGIIADSLMGRKLRQVAAERGEKDKVIKTVGDSDYTDLIINLKFKSDVMISDDTPNMRYDSGTGSIVEAAGKRMRRLISKKKLRQMAYRDGVTINGAHYVNFQRTSSKARIGNDLFIREDYFDEMDSWQNLGIPFRNMVKSGDKEHPNFFEKVDIVSIRSYQSLIASSIIGELDIDPYSILLIDDVSGQAEMECNVVKPFTAESGRGTELRVVREPYMQKTDLWDGQSLLDYSVFKHSRYITREGSGTMRKESTYEKYGFILLRNHFFKTAVFNTNLQEYYSERFKDVEDPVICDAFGNLFNPQKVMMVTTRNSVKIFKFADIICEYMIPKDKKVSLDGLKTLLDEKYKELHKAKQVVVKAKRGLAMLLNDRPEKDIKFSRPGDVVIAKQSLSEAEKSYDSICLRVEAEVKPLLKTIKMEQERLTWDWYREQIKGQRFGCCKTEHKSKFGDKQQLWYQVIGSLNFNREQLWKLAKPQIDEVNLMRKYVAWFKYFVDMRATDKAKDSMMLSLLNVNNDISRTKWYADYKRLRIKGIVDKLIAGKLQIENSDFCTLVGNPYEMLKASCGDKIEQSILNDFECYCTRYQDGEELYGMRSPHICTGNNALLKNTYRREWRWFNLSDNILIINLWGKGAFLSPKWNGSDTDSDAAFIGNHPIILEKVREVQNYLIPINCVPQRSKEYEFTDIEMAKVDGQLCNDSIGKICNFARDIQSMYWHLFNTGTEEKKKRYLPMMYDDICLLEVLSNIAIDSAKRRYECNIEAELKRIKLRPYMTEEDAVIRDNSIVFTETKFKKNLSEKKIKEYEKLLELREKATDPKVLEEIEDEIKRVLMVDKDYMMRPSFTKNLKAKPKGRKKTVYCNGEQKELVCQEQRLKAREKREMEEKIYYKMESPMDILSQIIREKVVRSPRTVMLPCFVDVLKPIPSGMKADYNRIYAIKKLCLDANDRLNFSRHRYKEGRLTYDEMYEEINTIEKDVINNIKERKITPYDINVLIRKVYDIRPQRDAHGRIIKDEKGKCTYVDKRDQELIQAKAGGLLLKYLYAAHKDTFLKAIKESGRGTISNVRKIDSDKKTLGCDTHGLNKVEEPNEKNNEIFILNGVRYEIYTERLKENFSN